MKTNVVFKDFQGFEHLNSFVTEALEATLAKFENKRTFDVKVIVGKAHAKHQGQPIHFQCEAIVTSDRKKNIFAKKVDENFYLAVKDCMKNLERLIRREIKTRIQLHRRGSHELPAFINTQIDESNGEAAS